MSEPKKQSEIESIKCSGGHRALNHAAREIRKQLPANLGELDQESIDLIKKHIERAAALCEHLAAMQKNGELISAGKAESLKYAVEVVFQHNQASVEAARKSNEQSKRKPRRATKKSVKTKK